MAQDFDLFPAVRFPQHNGEQATLTEDWTVYIKDPKINGGVLSAWLVVPAGTQTDGASIPRFLWRICGHPLEYPRIYAALVHDWLYGGGDPDVTREQADGIYRYLLIRYGWGKWKANIEYYALRMLGASHWHK